MHLIKIMSLNFPVSIFSDIPGREVFSCDPDSDGKLDTSTEFYQSMFEGHRKQRDAAEKYKSDRKSEKKIQKDVYGKLCNFRINLFS